MFRLILLCQSKTQVNRGPGYAYLTECLETNLACEQQTCFRSRERSDDRKYVCCSQEVHLLSNFAPGLLYGYLSLLGSAFKDQSPLTTFGQSYLPSFKSRPCNVYFLPSDVQFSFLFFVLIYSWYSVKCTNSLPVVKKNIFPCLISWNVMK